MCVCKTEVNFGGLLNHALPYLILFFGICVVFVETDPGAEPRGGHWVSLSQKSLPEPEACLLQPGRQLAIPSNPPISTPHRAGVTDPRKTKTPSNCLWGAGI